MLVICSREGSVKVSSSEQFVYVIITIIVIVINLLLSLTDILYCDVSCEGCKGFFKRSVRKELVYECREHGNNCQVDKSKRTRCQFCRYNKCLSLGMRREGNVIIILIIIIIIIIVPCTTVLVGL